MKFKIDKHLKFKYNYNGDKLQVSSSYVTYELLVEAPNYRVVSDTLKFVHVGDFESVSAAMDAAMQYSAVHETFDYEVSPNGTPITE